MEGSRRKNGLKNWIAKLDRSNQKIGSQIGSVGGQLDRKLVHLGKNRIGNWIGRTKNWIRNWIVRTKKLDRKLDRSDYKIGSDIQSDIGSRFFHVHTYWFEGLFAEQDISSLLLVGGLGQWLNVFCADAVAIPPQTWMYYQRPRQNSI